MLERSRCYARAALSGLCPHVRVGGSPTSVDRARRAVYYRFQRCVGTGPHVRAAKIPRGDARRLRAALVEPSPSRNCVCGCSAISGGCSWHAVANPRTRPVGRLEFVPRPGMVLLRAVRAGAGGVDFSRPAANRNNAYAFVAARNISTSRRCSGGRFGGPVRFGASRGRPLDGCSGTDIGRTDGRATPAQRQRGSRRPRPLDIQRPWTADGWRSATLSCS